jgi:hypothetical protein
VPLARASGHFGEVELVGDVLSCAAKGTEAEAFYRLSGPAAPGEAGLWVSLVTPDRYLSQSIEQDLVHRGDKIGELLNEELVDQGLIDRRDTPVPQVEHFRDARKLYTFRTPIGHVLELGRGGPELAAQTAFRWLAAYAAAFGELGGLAGGDDEA